MRIAYFSPLNPLKSGVSDYSEELLPFLSSKAEIDLYINNFQPSSEFIQKNYKIRSISTFNDELYSSYDEVIYHIGNNTAYHKEIYLMALKYPGVVILHDYSIHHLIANLTVAQGNWEGYIQEMVYNYGEEGSCFAALASQGKMKVMWESDKTIQYPANKRIIDRSKGVIVHSNLALEGVKSATENTFVKYAPLFTTDIREVTSEERYYLRSKYNIPRETLVLASFGFVSTAKRIHSVLEALQNIKDSNENILYLIVGEEEPGNETIKGIINKLGLNHIVRFIGFVSLEEFKDYIKISDVCVNLRYPTQGETSASLLRILGYGKPAIVSKIGTFSEFPDDCTIKIQSDNQEEEVKQLYDVINLFINERKLAQDMGNKALQYVKDHHSVAHTAEAYFEAIDELANYRAFSGDARFYYSYVDRYVEINRGILEKSEETQRRFANKLADFFE